MLELWWFQGWLKELVFLFLKLAPNFVLKRVTLFEKILLIKAYRTAINESLKALPDFTGKIVKIWMKIFSNLDMNLLHIARKSLILDGNVILSALVVCLRVEHSHKILTFTALCFSNIRKLFVSKRLSQKPSNSIYFGSIFLLWLAMGCCKQLKGKDT